MRLIRIDMTLEVVFPPKAGFKKPGVEGLGLFCHTTLFSWYFSFIDHEGFSLPARRGLKYHT
jgi:hypothetical protein